MANSQHWLEQSGPYGKPKVELTAAPRGDILEPVNRQDTVPNNPQVAKTVPWEGDRTPPELGTLPGLLEHHARTRPDAPAVVSNETRLTYRQLSEQAELFAAALEDFDVKEGTRVGLVAPNTTEWLVAALGALRLGATVSAFNTWVRSWDLNYLLKSSQTEVLIMAPKVRSTDLLGELREVAPDLWESTQSAGDEAKHLTLKHLIVMDGEVGATEPPPVAARFSELLRNAVELTVPANQAKADSTAYILYTSGTTKNPKAVPLQHRLLIANGFAIGTRMGLHHDDRIWLSSPLFWSFGCANAAMATMSHGACLVLQEHFDPLEAAQLMAQEQCTAAYLLPPMAIALAEKAGPELRRVETLRKGVTIGRPDEVQRVAIDLDIPEICNVYGSTEVYGNCCVTPHTLPLEERLESQGPPLPGVEIRIVDLGSSVPVDSGVSGEIQVRGRVTDGYIGDPEATQAAMTTDGWFKTGDTGLLRPDGSLQFQSRHTDMIKTSGINVSPAEVETFLKTHPAIEDIAVVGAPHPTRGEVVVGFAVLQPEAFVTGEAIRQFCKESIAGYKVPWIVEIVDQLPQTSTGKLTRRNLRQTANVLVSSALAETHERPATRGGVSNG